MLVGVILEGSVDWFVCLRVDVIRLDLSGPYSQ